MLLREVIIGLRKEAAKQQYISTWNKIICFEEFGCSQAMVDLTNAFNSIERDELLTASFNY